MNNLKVVILAGGFGRRISEYSKKEPKPMIRVGGLPIIVHIMNHYASYGLKKFIICLGYKKEIFFRFFKKKIKDYEIELVDTGLHSKTGDRLKHIKNKVTDNFFLTYGDGLSNLDLKKTYNNYLKKKKLAQVTCTNPISQYGVLKIKKSLVVKFSEKPANKNTWISIGFFIFNKRIFKYLKGKNIVLEKKLMEELVKKKQLTYYKHRGFWKGMDSVNDKIELEKILRHKRNKIFYE